MRDHRQVEDGAFRPAARGAPQRPAARDLEQLGLGRTSGGHLVGVRTLQRSAGNAAVARLLHPVPAPPRPGEGAVVVQRLVGPGLPHGTPVRSVTHGVGTIQVATATGYEVRFTTAARPPIQYQVRLPFADLHPVGAPAPVAAPAPQDSTSDSTQESAESDGDVRLDELPESVTLSGVLLDDWKGSGDSWVLAPTGAHYPHLTLLGRHGELDRVHFTSAEPRLVEPPGISGVSLVRRGYRWDGMRSRLVADPDFVQTEQLLAVKQRTATLLTFDLTGGRQDQQLAVDARHTAVPSVAEVATALRVPH